MNKTGKTRETQETQESIAQWADETFGETTILAAAFRANKEMSEMLSEVADLYAREQIEQLPIHGMRERLLLEIADVVITLNRLASVVGGNLDLAVDHKMAINRSRQWVRHGDGTGSHVK